jgi:LPS export ABC transporter permease LptG/LPS export ABC transporter permease LptF
MRIFDRYVIREVLLPLLLSMVLLTFLLIIPPFLKEGYPIIAKGVDAWIVAKVVATLLPQALAISIPMAVLLGLLIALGRFSGDREFVAMQACGVSIYQLVRPLVVIALLSTAATAYVMIVALPDANQAFREIIFREVASRVENNIRPRVLFTEFPDHVLYVRDVDTTSHVMRDVFFADSAKPGVTTLSFAREGRFIIDRVNKLVQLQLTHGNQHTLLRSEPDKYQGTEFDQLNLSLDAQTVFRQAPGRNPPEMTIAELRNVIATVKPRDPGSIHLLVEARLWIQNKFAIPVACCVLALVALALGVSNRKDGMLASFAIGFIVIFAYYVLLYLARAAAFGGKLSADVAPWISPAVIGVFGIILTIWRAKSTDRPPLLAWTMSRAARRADPGAGDGATPPETVTMFARTPVTLPWIKILDMYTSRQYIQVFLLSVFSALGVFYISTFIDLADKLFRGSATTSMLLRFFYYMTPQYLYYIIPIAVLVATLVTIGVMTKNSELIVMKACGMSLYRAAAPLVLFAVAASVGLFGLQELVLARANRRADRLEGVIRSWPSTEPSAINRWISSETGDIYHYDLYEPATDRFQRFSRYHVDRRDWRLSGMLFADSVVMPLASAKPEFRNWTAEKGWERTLTASRPGEAARTAVSYTPFLSRPLTLEAPAYFKAEQPEPAKMNYRQLRAHIEQLRASGYNTVAATVQLQRKVAFPFATVIMALLAIPFAVTTGRRGAMYGIGIGIALSIAYWVILNVFSAVGEGGVMTPMLAAWAPNMLFGVVALYMVLTVRT